MLNRRELIRAAGLAAAHLSAGRFVLGASTLSASSRQASSRLRRGSGGQAGQAADKPTRKLNIVLFISDDHGVDDCGAYGDRVVRTPNIDRLAREGMRFTRAFAASPLCSPSRCVLETGLMPFRNGGHKFGTPISRGVQTMPQYFRKLGYHTAHVGKFHHGPRKQFPYDTIIRDEHKGGDFIARYNGDKPLLLLVCSTFPHTPWAKNDGYDPAKIELPPTFVDTPITRRQRCQYYTEVTMMDRQLGRVLEAIKKRGWDDNTLVLYTSDQGSNWPFAKWCLYDAGIRVPLIARLSRGGRGGRPAKIRPGSVTDAMVSLADLLPTFLAAAGAAPPKDIDGQSFLGVLHSRKKTHRDAIFAAHTGNDNGGPGIANHCPMRAVRTATHKYILNLHPERTFTTHITGCRPGSAHYLAFWDSWVKEAKTDPRAAKVVRAYMHRPREELYDLTRDPHERKNLAASMASSRLRRGSGGQAGQAADPALGELLTSLRKRLAEWRKQQGDPTL